MAAPLQYLLFTLKVAALEEVSFSDTQNRKTVNTLTVNHKHYLLNRNNLTQPIQTELSERQKKCCRFFFEFLKSISNYRHFPKKYDLDT